MAKLKNLTKEFFIDGTVKPATDITKLKPEILQNNEFVNADLEREIIEIGEVLAVENHPRKGWFKVKLPKRTAMDKSFPGFSFHSKHFIDFNPQTEVLNVFECKVKIKIKVGGVEKTEEILAKDLLAIYKQAGSRLITYTDDHSI